MEFRFKTKISEKKDEERTSSKNSLDNILFVRVCGNKLYMW